MGSEENGNLVYGEYSRKPHIESSFFNDNLEAGAEYYLRIKSVANGKESYWAYLDDRSKTVTEEDVLNVPAEEDLPGLHQVRYVCHGSWSDSNAFRDCGRCCSYRKRRLRESCCRRGMD